MHRLKQTVCTQGKETAIVAVLVMIAAALTLAWIGFHQAGIPMADASYRPGDQDEAEYNAWAGGEPDTEVYLPFVNSDPAWGWRTTAIVQNTGTDTATVTLLYYDTVGAVADARVDTLPAMGSRAYPTSGVFSGSLVITATQPVAVIANELSLDSDWTGDGLMSYRGVGGSGGADEITLLPIYRAYQGWNSLFAVQNMANTAISISLTFYDLTGTVVYSQDGGLPPRRAQWYDAATMPGLGTGFYGRVHVQSATHTPVAGVVHAVNSQTGEAVAHNNRSLKQVVEAYELCLPHLSKRWPPIPPPPVSYDGYSHTSDIVLYNRSQSTATVVVTLYDQDGTGVANYAISGLPPYATQPISLYDLGWSPPVPEACLGSGVVSSDQPVGALVNTICPDVSRTTLTGYSGVAPAGTDTTAYVPFVRRSADGAVTQISVQNAGSVDADVFVTYYGEDGSPVGGEVAAVPAYAARYFGQAESSLPTPFRGSAVVTSTQPVAVLGFISHERPATPALLSPPDGTLTRTTDITFTWSDVNAAGYNLKLNRSVFTATDTYSATVLADGIYTWTVRAFDAAGAYSPYATPWMLTVDTKLKLYLPIVVRSG